MISLFAPAQSEIRNPNSAIAVLLTALALVCLNCRAEEMPKSIDELPHKPMVLPNNKTIELYELNSIRYQRVELQALADLPHIDDGLCFEGKVAAPAGAGALKLAGSDIPITANEAWLRDKIKVLKTGDNVSCFGMLHALDGGKLEFVLSEVFKEAGDAQRAGSTLAALEKRESSTLKPQEQETLAQEYFAFGRRVYASANQPFLSGDDNFTLKRVSRQAFDHGLKLMEQAVGALRPNDAESYFQLAQDYKEFMHEPEVHAGTVPGKYHQWILKSLELNPDHPGASSAAERMGYVKFEGKWMTVEKRDELIHQRNRDQDELAKLEAERTKAVRDRIATEGQLLAAHLAADLTGSDAARTAAALEFLGEILKRAPEAGAPLLETITELDHPNALTALKTAGLSPSPTMRRLAYEALVWRSGRPQESDTALGFVCDALKAETVADVGRTGVEALVALRTKPAIGTLVCSLATKDAAVREEIMAGLRAATHQTLSDREAWEDWWAKNKTGGRRIEITNAVFRAQMIVDSSNDASSYRVARPRGPGREATKGSRTATHSHLNPHDRSSIPRSHWAIERS